MLLVTFHGGKPGEHPLRNNVHARDKGGRKLTSAVLEDVKDVVLDELRGMYRVGKLLYVANAHRTQNSVLCYRGSGKCYRLIGTFASRDTCKGIVHPFDLTFDGKGYCYVSSQDTNVVTRLRVSKDGKTGTPAPIPPALRSHGEFPPGTFVASSVGRLCGMATPGVPAPMGLHYYGTGLKKHSVRGVEWAKNALYVADEPAGTVKVYDGDANFLGQSNQVESPVHLEVHEGSLYVSGGNSVFRAQLPSPAGDLTLSEVPGLRVKNGGGMAFTKKGRFYIASRTRNTILKFDSDFRPMKFACNLPDNPEFLLHI
jgi:hypothetical protein